MKNATAIPNPASSLSEWMSEPECASSLGITVPALARLRAKGEAPPYIRVSPRAAVLYAREGVEDYLRELYVNSAAPVDGGEAIGGL